MGQVLISYSREERDRAAWLADRLEKDGWEVWWDLHLAAGSIFDEEIDRRLKEADAVVVLWSRASVASRWVKAEAEVAAERDVLVPVLLEDVEIPLPFRRMHAADLGDWRGQPDHPGLAQVRLALDLLSVSDSGRGSQAKAPRPHGRRMRPAGRWPWIGWRAWLGLTALVAALAVGVFVLGSRLTTAETVVVPDLIGMRLDEAHLELSRLGIYGPGLRQATGEPFPDDSVGLDTRTRVKDISPPPGSEVPSDEPDVTLYLEFCNGACSPKPQE